MSVFKQPKNKRFQFTSRHLKEGDGESQQHRNLEWQETKRGSKPRGKSFSTLLVFGLILGMIIVLWFVLDHYKM